jgi:uncharacterized protein
VTLAQGVLVTAASAAAGLVNAVAGGGTLLSFPALVVAGLSPVTANVTSTVALWPGQISSVLAYRTHISEERRRALTLAIPSLIGGTIGSILLLALPESAFEAIVPWLILFACALLAVQGPIRKAVGTHAASNHPVALWVIQFLISIYGGYFGAGIGILMLAAMGILLPSSIQHANALKILFALLTNGIAVVLFAVSGRVVWPVAALMMAASLVGGWLGARVAQKLPPAGMRGFAIAVGLIAAGKFLFT